MKASPVLLACLLIVSAALEADPLIPRAQQREKSGDTAGAAHLYAAWLKANAGAPGSMRVFSRYFLLENDYLALRDISLKVLAAARGLPGAADQYAAIARLFEIGGMTGEARDAYMRAYAEGAADSTLVAAFLLSHQMHDTDAMARCLAALKTRSGPEGDLLKALADIEAGHAESAATLSGLADSSGDPDVALKALWIMFARARAAEDQKGQTNARARLSSDFPGSPEAALASSPRTTTVVLFPSPDFLITADAPEQALPQAGEPAQAPAVSQTTVPARPSTTPQATEPAESLVTTQAAEPVQPPETPHTSEPAKVSVQAGSFQVKENADDLSSELSKRGFSPIQRMETIQGRQHYRVFVGAGLDTAHARVLLAKLLQQGFSGMLVAEK